MNTTSLYTHLRHCASALRLVTILLLTGTGLTSCGDNDEGNGLTLSEGKALTFRAAMSDATTSTQPHSRAAADVPWKSGELFGVEGQDRFATRQVVYRLNETGNDLIPYDRDNTLWERDADDGITITSWYYPGMTFDAAHRMPTEYTVQADQSSLEGVALSDFLMGTKRFIYEYSQSYDLPFEHCMAKLRVNVKYAEGLTPNRFDRFDWEYAFEHKGRMESDRHNFYAVGDGSGRRAPIVPMKLAQPADGADATYEFIVPQQLLSKGGRLATFTFGSDLATAPCYLPADKELQLVSGLVATVTLTIMRSKIQVQTNDYATDWNTADGDHISDSLPALPGCTYDSTNNTYTVWDVDGFDIWRDAVDRGNADANCILLADIDYGGNEWLTLNVAYAGTFTGNGHTLSNMTIKPGMFDSNRHGGLFRDMNGKVQGLTMVNISLPSLNPLECGIIAARSGGIITDCTIRSCTIKGRNNVGSVVGELYANGVISDCLIDNSSISSDTRVGGIVGYSRGVIERCRVEETTLVIRGEVPATRGIIDGITGQADPSASIKASSFYGFIQGGTAGGGIVGWNDGRLTACWASADILDTTTLGGVAYLNGRRTSSDGIPAINTCCWSGAATVGVVNDPYSGDTVIRQVTGAYTQEDVDAMNAALDAAHDGRYGWHYILVNDRPKLVKRP